MSEYRPDNWVVLKIGNIYKVLGGWSGGYLDGDAWRLNSGITKATIGGKHVVFEGTSGSKYICHKDTYGLRMNNAGVYNQIADRVELMPEDTEWMDLDYGLSNNI